MIRPADLGGDENVARRVLVRARLIAPCIDSLVDGIGPDIPTPRADAIAILQAVMAEVPKAGQRAMRSFSRNGTSMSRDSAAGAFTLEDIADLRSLCGHDHGAVAALGPRGAFDKPGWIDRLFPVDR